MRKFFMAVFFVGCATASPTPTRPAKAYQNVFDVGDDRGHRYTFRWPSGTKVHAKARAKLSGLGVGVSAKGSYVVPDLDFTASGGDITVVVHASRDSGEPEAGRYVLELEPGPEVEVSLPTQNAEETMAARVRRFEAKNSENRKREALKTWRAQVESQKASICAPGKNDLYAAIKENDVFTYRFCDGSELRSVGGKTSLARSLGGADYDSFVSREKSVMEVAEHNASVLGTPQWQQRAVEARAAFEARVSLFISKNRKPEAWYVAQARRPTVPVIGE